MNAITARTFPASTAALAVFDAGQTDRDAAWGRSESNEDVFACVIADDAALAVVQQAFYEDTCDINSRNNCALVDIAFIRACVDQSV